MDRRTQLGLLGGLDPVAAPKLPLDRRDREERTLWRLEQTHRLIARAFYFQAVVLMRNLGDDAMECHRSRRRPVIAQLACDTAPASEVNRQQRRNRPRYSLGSEGRELGRKTIGVDLEQPLGPGDVLQIVLAEVAQPDIK